MKEIEEIISDISSLPEYDRFTLLVKLLDKSIINYTEFNESYIYHLKQKEKAMYININGLAGALGRYVVEFKTRKGKQSRFLRAKALYHLIKSGVFKGSVNEKRYIEEMKGIDYTEDQNGSPTYNDKAT